MTNIHCTLLKLTRLIICRERNPRYCHVYSIWFHLRPSIRTVSNVDGNRNNRTCKESCWVRLLSDALRQLQRDNKNLPVMRNYCWCNRWLRRSRKQSVTFNTRNRLIDFSLGNDLPWAKVCKINELWRQPTLIERHAGWPSQVKERFLEQNIIIWLSRDWDHSKRTRYPHGEITVPAASTYVSNPTVHSSVPSKLRNCVAPPGHLCSEISFSRTCNIPRFNIVCISHSRSPLKTLLCLCACAIACALKQKFSQCKIFFGGTLVHSFAPTKEQRINIHIYETPMSEASPNHWVSDLRMEFNKSINARAKRRSYRDNASSALEISCLCHAKRALTLQWPVLEETTAPNESNTAQ